MSKMLLKDFITISKYKSQRSFFIAAGISYERGRYYINNFLDIDTMTGDILSSHRKKVLAKIPEEMLYTKARIETRAGLGQNPKSPTKSEQLKWAYLMHSDSEKIGHNLMLQKWRCKWPSEPMFTCCSKVEFNPFDGRIYERKPKTRRINDKEITTGVKDVSELQGMLYVFVIDSKIYSGYEKIGARDSSAVNAVTNGMAFANEDDAIKTIAAMRAR